MKCRYTQCKYGGEVGKADAVKDGRMYFHKECYKERANKAKIRQLYIDHIDNKVVYKVLNAAINDIIDGKNVDSDYLLFVMEYIIDHNMKLNYPYGLHYYLSNKEIKQAWSKRERLLLKQQLKDTKVETHTTKNIEYNIEDDRDNWSKLLG